MAAMCLLVLAWMKHSRYRLVVAANRDEFHERPAAPLAWWGDAAAMLSGRDLAAGGTWMGVDRAGRFGAVTNFREPGQATPTGTPSRGTLVPRFLAGEAAPAGYIERLHESAAEFAGFNLLVAGSRSLLYFSNRAAGVPRQLEPGVYGLSNHELDSPWPKLTKARERLAAEIDCSGELELAPLFDLLADRSPDPDQVLPAKGVPTDIERAISAPFVLHPRYGTRCSTVLLAGHDGRVVAAERRFDADGSVTGTTHVEFAIDEPR
jgi:uncharacterized protein with NRDE domain